MKSNLSLALASTALCLAFSATNLMAQAEPSDVFTLQLLHASDLEGGVEAIPRAPFFAAIVDGLENQYSNTIRMSAGDNYIPGPFFNASSDPSLRTVLRSVSEAYFGIEGPTDIREAAGRIDISICNILGLDASALGNHEFDLGTSVVQELIGTQLPGLSVASSRWYGAQFPYLSANLDFSNDVLAPLYTSSILSNEAFRSSPMDIAAAAVAPKIAPATIIERNGELIGVVGATTQVLNTISSPGNVVGNSGTMNNMPALAAVLQPVIDALSAEGCNRTILVSHL
jgi:2',3'-cyclic-nucleotide 2'-phosphodiesterase (5'-nucleotidase family)